MTRLLQYTAGPAKEAIRSCLLVGGESGFNQALSILANRYGNPYLVTERIVNNLRQNKPVRTGIEVQQLADDLKNAEMILSQINKLNEVDSQSTILTFVGRLQPYLQIKWKTRALDIKRMHGAYPGFYKLVEFLANAAADINDPVYGNVINKNENVSRSKCTSYSAQAFDRNTPRNNIPDSGAGFAQRTHLYARPESPCVLCDQRHRLWHCHNFRRMLPRERLHLVRTHKLCENCL